MPGGTKGRLEEKGFAGAKRVEKRRVLQKQRLRRREGLCWSKGGGEEKGFAGAKIEEKRRALLEQRGRKR